MAKNDPSDEVRKSAMFALSQSREPEALSSLIQFARQDASPKVRGDALFWLSQKAGQRAAAEITAAIERDPDTDVKKRAVFALSQLPKDEGRAAADSGREGQQESRRPQAGDLLARPVAGPQGAGLLRTGVGEMRFGFGDLASG